MPKNLIIFMPSIEGGGVEKNLFIISKYLSNYIKNISIVSLSKKYKKKFNKEINFLTLKNDFWDKIGRRKKFIISLLIIFPTSIILKSYLELIPSSFFVETKIFC